MPRKRSKPKETEEHTHLSMSVQNYDVSVSAGINPAAYGPQYAWRLDDRDPLFEFTQHVTITSKSTYPEKRAGDTYEFTIYSNDAPSADVSATLRDAQARDENRTPQYREYRGRHIPIYDPPKGFALLEKVRGEPRWTSWLPVSGRFASDLVALLGQKRPLFMTVHEMKSGKGRWVRGLTFQTIDPNEE